MTEAQFALLLLGLVSLAITAVIWRGQRQSVLFEKVEQMSSQYNEVILRVIAVELELSGYKLWNGRLRVQVYELGGTPVPPPPWLIVTETARPEREVGDVMVEAY